MFQLSPIRHSTIALDAGPASVALCQLAGRRGNVRFERGVAIEDPLRDRPVEDPFAPLSLERTTRLLQQASFHGRSAAVALKPPDVTFHTFTLPPGIRAAPRRELLAPLRLEMARQMQSEPDEIELEFWDLPRGARQGDNVMIAATRSATVEGWERFCSALGLTLAEVDVLPCALLRAAWRAGSPAAPATKPGSNALWGVLDIGFGSPLLTLAIGRCCVYVRALTVGGDGLTLAIVDALDVDYKTAEALKRGAAAESPDVQQAVQGVLRSRIRALAAEIERAFAYAIESYPQATLEGLYLCGGGARSELLGQSLRETLGLDVRTLDASIGLNADRGQSDDRAPYTACIGLALRGFLN